MQQIKSDTENFPICALRTQTIKHPAQLWMEKNVWWARTKEKFSKIIESENLLMGETIAQKKGSSIHALRNNHNEGII